jgi:hypothetical protein
MLEIGLDPGVKTGYAEWDDATGQLIEVETLKVHQAMQRISDHFAAGRITRVVFEDARQRRWFGGRDRNQAKYGAGVREGAGSIKRDCTILEDFLTDLGVTFSARPPAAGATKWDSAYFARVTGWKGRTSTHSRDAALLVYRGRA